MTNKEKLKEVIMKTFGLSKYDVDLTYLKGCEILRCKAEDLCQHCGNMDFLDKEFAERTLNAPEKVQNEIRDKNMVKLVAAQGDKEQKEYDKALIMLLSNYEYAKTQKFIRKPLSNALYETWRYFDQNEKPRGTKD